MSREAWDERHRRHDSAEEPEPFVAEMLPLLPRGTALDVAAGRGRHSLALARAGLEVVAVDWSVEGLAILSATSRAEKLAIWPVAADLATFPIRESCYDAIVNVNFLERALFPSFKAALRPGGTLLVDTFLIDQAALGHPRNPLFLLDHYELRELLAGLELLRYLEGIVVYRDGTKAWRACALARKT